MGPLISTLYFLLHWKLMLVQCYCCPLSTKSYLCCANSLVTLLDGCDLVETLAIPGFISPVHFVLWTWFQRILPSPRPVCDNMPAFKVGPIVLPKNLETTSCRLSTPACAMYGFLILFNSYCLSLPATFHHVWAVSRVGYINMINKPTGSGKH
jgi:hypothetical protein